MLKYLTVLFCALCLLVPAALADLDGGYVEANLDSVTSSYTPTNWGQNDDLRDPPRYRLLTQAETTTCNLTVGFRVRDDSRLAGYSNKVEGTLNYFDFTTQTWKPNSASNNTFTKTGSNVKWGKYNDFASNSWALAQPYPVTKYSLGLVSDTRGVPTKRVWKEFYVAKNFPTDPSTHMYTGNKSAAVRNAAPSWYASRMELAQILRHLKVEWDAMSVSTPATINFDDEMRKILTSAAGLAGPTSASDYAQNSGMEALSLAATIFGSVATSTLVSAGGEIYEAYQMYKWCTDTLNSSLNIFNTALGSYTMYQATVAGNRQSNPSYYLQSAAEAAEADANELIRIVYTDPNGSAAAWKTLLATERDRFNSLMVSVTSCRGTTGSSTSKGADEYLNLAGASGTREKIDKYFDIVWKLAYRENALLVKATL